MSDERHNDDAAIRRAINRIVSGDYVEPDAIVARVDAQSGPPLMFFFRAEFMGESAVQHMTRLIESRLADGKPLIFVGMDPDSVVVLQLVDGRWVPAWPVAADATVPADDEPRDELA